MSLVYVYCLRSVRFPDKSYVGATSDLRRRLSEHNSGNAKHTSKYRPWKVDFAIWLGDEEKAFALERYLKTASGKAFITHHF
jgi:putative endonuclease